VSGPSPLMLFTDLDGSLLDHHSYSFEPARPMLQALEDRGVPVVPTSSKTRAEIEQIRSELGNRHPFIVENGAAVFIPCGYFPRQPEGTVEREGYWVYECSAGRSQWLQLLAGLETGYPGEYEYFYRAGPAGIATMTGLGPAAAELANQREYSEPVQWLGSEARKLDFAVQLSAAGANPLQGGRFLTVAGDCDKGRALAWLREAYRGAWNLKQVHDLAAGDSGNDVAMLEAAQTALVIRSPVHDFPQLKRTEGVIYSTQPGPQGWAEGVERWLESQTPTADQL
jgi:mannosyl-3-phosphoglycerate phosphatase